MKKLILFLTILVMSTTWSYADDIKRIDETKVQITQVKTDIQILDINELKTRMAYVQDLEDRYVAAREDEKQKIQAEIDAAASVGVNPAVASDITPIKLGIKKPNAKKV